ncbi:MAG: hypothetical protein WCD70_10860 [Alphaproteobacteria bacterium]
MTTVFVTVAVLGAFALSGAAVMENARFVKATNQILEPIGLVRGIIAQQQSFVEIPGQDVWADLARLGRVASATDHLNPWGSDVHVVAVTNAMIRVESDLPAHDCRRMALYFLNQAQGFGIVAIEAQPFEDILWARIYPPPENMSHNRAVELACGDTHAARLGLIFKVR